MPNKPIIPNANANAHAEAQVPDLEQFPPIEVPSGPSDIPTVPWDEIAANFPYEDDPGNAGEVLAGLFVIG